MSPEIEKTLKQKEIISKILVLSLSQYIDVKEISFDSDLREFGMEESDIVGLGYCIEEMFLINLPRADRTKFNNLTDFLNIIDDKATVIPIDLSRIPFYYGDDKGTFQLIIELVRFFISKLRKIEE